MDVRVLDQHVAAGLHTVHTAVDVRPVDAGAAGPDAIDGGRRVRRYELGVLDHRVRSALGVQQRGVDAGRTATEDAVLEGDVAAGDLAVTACFFARHRR